MRSHAWRRLREAFDLNETRLCRRSLRERRRTDVSCQDVRVPCTVETSGLHGIPPGAGRQLDDVFEDVVSDGHARQRRSPVVEYPNEVSFCEATPGGVVRVHPDLLATIDLGGEARLAVVPLGVQLRLWLIRDHVQWIVVRVPEPLRRLHPRRVWRALDVSEVLDRLRVKFDQSGRGRQWACGRVVGKRREPGGCRWVPFIGDLEVAGVSQFGERRIVRVVGAEALIEVFDPFVAGAAFAEPIGGAEAKRQVGEDVVVVPRLADRLDGLRHPEDEVIRRASAYIVALERGCRRQHDVGVAGERVPERLVNDDGVRPLPRLRQPIQVLVVVEGVASCPIHEMGLRVREALPVVVELFATVQEQVRDPGDRDEVGHVVPSLRKPG